jgi:NADH-quinone oxidoreductase subunit C
MADEKQDEQPKPAGGTPPPATPPTPPASEAKPAAAAAPKAAAPAKPAGPTPQPWDGELVRSLRASFADVTIEAFNYLGDNYFIVPRESILPILMYLKSESQFEMLADLTAADYPKREKRFEVIYQLYSFARNERLRVKAPVGEDEPIESAVPVWSAADWLEREAFDMFGIRFAHHPNLTRILLPEEWQGYPLRKDYGILQQDVKWVQENLHIDSGQ